MDKNTQPGAANQVPEMLGVKETAERLNIPEFTVRRWVNNETFPAIRSGNKIYINFTLAAQRLNSIPYNTDGDVE